MPLNNSSEVFGPANDIETVLISQSLGIKNLNETHYAPLFTSDHVCTNCHENYIYSVRSYSKHLKENRSRVNHVYCVSR